MKSTSGQRSVSALLALLLARVAFSFLIRAHRKRYQIFLNSFMVWKNGYCPQQSCHAKLLFHILMCCLGILIVDDKNLLSCTCQFSIFQVRKKSNIGFRSTVIDDCSPHNRICDVLASIKEILRHSHRIIFKKRTFLQSMDLSILTINFFGSIDGSKDLNLISTVKFGPLCKESNDEV